MTKIFKRIIFWLFILALVILIGNLAIRGYIEANGSRAVAYLVEKYELHENDLNVLKYQEYVYEDITNCDSLWLKECSPDKDLHYEYILRTDDGHKIIVKERIDGSFEDDYSKGTIREEYLEKEERKKNNSTKTETDQETETIESN